MSARGLNGAPPEKGLNSESVMMHRVIILIVLLPISSQLTNSQSEGERSPLTLIPLL